MKLPRRFAKRGRVEIIPLIDTVLILLIFYMSFSSFREKELELPANLPSLIGKGEALDILIQIAPNGEMKANGVLMDPSSLHHALGTMAAADPRTAVVISAEPDTKYQHVIRALDVCAQAKLTKVSFRPLAG